MILFKIVEIWQVLYFTVDSCLVLNCLLFNFVCSSMSFQCSLQFCMVLYVLVQFLLVIHNLILILYLVSTRYFLVLYLPVLFSLAQDFLYIGLSKAKELISPFLTQNTTLNHSLQVYLEAKLLQGGLYRTTSNSSSRTLQD